MQALARQLSFVKARLLPSLAFRDSLTLPGQSTLFKIGLRPPVFVEVQLIRPSFL